MLGGVRRKVIDEAEFALHVTRIAQPSLQYVACGARRKICCGGSGRVGRGPPSASGGPGRGGVRKPSAYLTAQHARRRDRVVSGTCFRQSVASPAWHARRQRPNKDWRSGPDAVLGGVRVASRLSTRRIAIRHETHLAIPIANPRPRADCRLCTLLRRAPRRAGLTALTLLTVDSV